MKIEFTNKDTSLKDNCASLLVLVIAMLALSEALASTGIDKQTTGAIFGVFGVMYFLNQIDIDIKGWPELSESLKLLFWSSAFMIFSMLVF